MTKKRKDGIELYKSLFPSDSVAISRVSGKELDSLLNRVGWWWDERRGKWRNVMEWSRK